MSAGILLAARRARDRSAARRSWRSVLAHGAWSIPKGEIGAADAPEMVARPESAEELGPRASIGRLAATSGGPTARREARYRIRRRGPF